MNVNRRKLGGCSPHMAICLFLAALASATPIQLVSRLETAQLAPAGGNGDSCLPVLSFDGRYVLFASTANNLVLASNNIPIPSLVPARFNVYLRDRTNQTTALVSRSTNGAAGGNGDSFPVALSTNGQFALLESSASNLVASDTNNAADVILRDLNSGETFLISISTNGLPGNGASRSAVMTPDGRYVAFVSEANNLVTGDTNRIADVFLRDVQALTTTLVSVGARSTIASLVPLNSSESPQITPDARFIAFSSTATNLVPGVQTVGDIYVHDRIAGTNFWASSGMRALLQSTGQTNGISHNFALSENGKFVAYQASRASQPTGTYSGIMLRYGLESGLTDLVHTNAPTSIPAAMETRNLDLTPDGGIIAFVANSNGVSGATTCVQVWDAATGITTLASGDLTNSVTTGSISTHPVLDSSGRFVTFLSSATGLVTNAVSGAWHLYVRDLLNSTTTLANADANGAGSTLTAVSVPSLSADVRFVAFEGEDGALVANDNNRVLDVFVRDLTAGTNELISAAHPALASATPNGMSLVSPFPASADGRYIAFASEADNLVPADTNGFRDVFVRDLASGTNLLVSSDPSGVIGNGISFEPAMSGDGRYVAFRSTATNLVAGDTNHVADIFVRDLQTGITLLASQAAGAGTAPGNAFSPSLSADGRWLLFRSQAVGTSVESGTLFLRDMQLATNWVLTSSAFVPPVMTPDGRFVAFVGPIPGTASLSSLYLWDSSLRARVLTNATSSINGIAVSSDGNLLAYHTSTELRLVDRALQTNWLASSLASASRPIPRFSADGNWLAYSRYVAPWHQVFLYDIPNRTERLISHAPDGMAGSVGHSDLPDLTPDGRFVVYRTLATNIVVGGNGITRQIILYDRQTGVNTLVSASRFTGGPADDHSQRAVFSADGQTLLLQSWASDLAAGDFNFSGDVLATTIFTAIILPSSAPGEGPWLSWPILPGGNYRVQFKNDLSDTNWQNLPGTPATLGVKAWLQDSTPGSLQRFYRVFSY